MVFYIFKIYRNFVKEVVFLITLIVNLKKEFVKKKPWNYFTRYAKDINTCINKILFTEI